MRATKAAALFIILGLMLVSSVFAVFPKTRPGPVKDAIRRMRGFGPAESAEDAIDKFRRAIKDRDFETAATFVGGDFGELMAKAAEPAENVAHGVDDLLDVMESNQLKSDKTRYALKLLEPFPRELSVKGKIDSRGDSTLVTLLEEPFRGDVVTERWNIDPRMLRTLYFDPLDLRSGTFVVVEVKKVGKSWKLFFPPDFSKEGARSKIDRLRENHGNYVRALTQVKNSAKNDAVTRENILQDLRRVLEDENKQ